MNKSDTVIFRDGATADADVLVKSLQKTMAPNQQRKKKKKMSRRAGAAPKSSFIAFMHAFMVILHLS